MPIWLTTLLEIIKVTVPALIVFWTVRSLMQEYQKKEVQLKALDVQKANQSTVLPMKLQAYERLSLFCERIAVPTLLFRLRQDGMSANHLRLQMLLAIQQEYEHNITQQVYVSHQLWEIIKIARDDSVNTISLAMEALESDATGQDLFRSAMAILEKRQVTAIDKALQAIKKEAGQVLS